jgi:hypothetical protein
LDSTDHKRISGGERRHDMHILSHLVAALITWLNAPEGTLETPPTPADWADLPTYHPSRD